MGQYYKLVNLDKKQFVNPHSLGDGSKLMELNRTATALAVLCSSGNGRGGGDCRSGHPIVGSWAGDRIVVAGDYADEGLYAPDGKTLYHFAATEFRDVSSEIEAALKEDDGR